jgi:hypothetical protein
MGTATKAVLASFSVYLLPVVGPHMAMFWGVLLGHEVYSGPDKRQAAWIAADLGLALLLQLAAFGLWFWFFRKPGWARLLALAASVSVFFTALMWGYLYAIPSHFLIEDDPSPEISRWPEECGLDGYSLVDLKTSADTSLAEAGQAWVVPNTGGRLAVLEMPGCQVRETQLDWTSARMSVAFVGPDGRAMYLTFDSQGQNRQWWYLAGFDAPPAEVKAPADTGAGHPAPSRNGEWAGWIQREKQPTPGGTQRLLLTQLPAGEEIAVSLEPFLPGSFELLAVDEENRTVHLARNYREFLTLGFDGAPQGPATRPEHTDPLGNSFRWVRNGWVAWDGYQDTGAYRVEWSLPAGSGLHRVPKGRGITSVAADPLGRYIAVSVTTSLNIGNIADSVYVLRASGGAEVFRQRLPPYSRSQVRLLGGEWFAYTSGERVRVLRIDGPG